METVDRAKEKFRGDKMKTFTATALGSGIGLLAFLSFTTLTQILPSSWFGYWIIFVTILNIVCHSTLRTNSCIIW